MKKVIIKNKIAVITLFIIFLVSFILWSLDFEFGYYIAGALVGAICHLIMIKHDEDAYSLDMKNPLVKATFNPKKSAIIWYIIRFSIFGVSFILMALLTNIWASKSNIINIIFGLLGYITIKAVFIVLMYKRKEGDELDGHVRRAK